MHRLTRHLTKRYLWAASVLLVAISLSVGYAFYVSKMQESDAKVINIAGMQRMLSQKISLHRQALNSGPSAFDEQQLQEAVERFLANHQFLLQNEMLQSKDVARLLAPQSELDLKVREFAQQALAGDDMTVFSGPQLVTLLHQLDGVVSALEQRSRANMVYLQQVLSLLILVAILIAWGEWVFIFKPLSKRLSKIMTKLRGQRRVVIRASRIKDDFIANVSHELLTPINGILGLLSTPQNTTPADIENATYCARNLHSIVQEMLDLHQLQTGRFTLHKSTQQLETTIKSILAPVELDKRFASRVELQGLRAQKVHLYTDHVRLIQVLNQLVSNALVHTQQQVIIDVQFSGVNEHLIVEVRDFGGGIDVRDLAAAQHNSLHYDNKKVQDFKGAKLGLSLAFAITRLARAQLHFEHLQNGTLAQLIWPASEAQEDGYEVFENSHNEKSALIVDDNKINQMVLRNIIEMLGFKVDVAADGKMAVELAKHYLYDCIFMDINMPNMDGIEATKRIRQQRNSDTPIILVTASQDQQRVQQGLQAGANTAIYKPIEIEHIKAALEKVQLHCEAL